MKNLKLNKIIAVILAAISLSTLHTLSAEAAWVKNSNGWWNTEGNSWSIGWRNIDNEWYYFGSNGYMKTGWIQDNDKWYYLNVNGAMVKNTNIDGYKIGEDGSWIEDEEQENKVVENNNDSDSQNSSIYPKDEINMAEYYVKSQDYKIIKNMGGVSSYSLNKEMLYDSIDSTINQQIWLVQKDDPDKYFGKQIKVYGFTVENHPLEKIFNVNTNIYIMICDGKIIGGYSIPNDDSNGAVYSLDGQVE